MFIVLRPCYNTKHLLKQIIVITGDVVTGDITRTLFRNIVTTPDMA